MNLSDEELKEELGVASGLHRKKILLSIQKLLQEGGGERDEESKGKVLVVSSVFCCISVRPELLLSVYISLHLFPLHRPQSSSLGVI